MQRNLRLFYLYRLLAACYFFVPTQVRFLESCHLTWTEILTLNSVFSAVLIAFEVPTGAWADRVGRRAAMALGSLLMAGGCLLYYASASFPAFLVAESLCALGMSFTSGPDSAYLFDLLKAEKRASDYPHVEGRASSFKYVGMALASAAGGFMGRHDPALPYGVAAAVCLLAALAAMALHEAPATGRARVSSVAGYVPQMRHALARAFHARRLRYAILYSSLVFVLLRISLWLYQPYLVEAGFDLGTIGLVFAGLYGIAAWSSHRVRFLRAQFRNGSIYWALPAILAVSYGLLGPLVSVWGIGLMVAQKVVDGIYSPLTKDLLNREIDDSAERACLLSVESMVRRLVFTLFAPLSGLVIDRFGRAGAFYLCAAVAGLGAGALLLRSRARERAKVVALSP